MCGNYIQTFSLDTEVAKTDCAKLRNHCGIVIKYTVYDYDTA